MAEDIKINEVQTVNDASFITVILEDGSLGKIAKADMANAMNAMLTNLETEDLDAVLRTGIYLIGSSCTNTPPASGQTIGCILLHLSWDANSAKQLYFPYNSNTIYYRYKTVRWNAWRQL